MKFRIIVLLVIAINLASCKLKKENQSSFIEVNTYSQKPITIESQITLNECKQLYFKDTACWNLDFFPGQLIDVNKQISYTLYFNDSLKIEFLKDSLVLLSKNETNKKYNIFFNGFANQMNQIIQKQLGYLINNENSVLIDENYISNYLDGNDSLMLSKTIAGFKNDSFSSQEKKELVSFILGGYKLSLEFSHFCYFINKIDKNEKLNERLKYYTDKVNRQELNQFAYNSLASILEYIANKKWGASVKGIHSKKKIEEYYSFIKNNFTANSIAYDYLVYSLAQQALRKNIKCKKLSNNNPFKQYLSLKNLKIGNKDNQLDKSLYESNFQSIGLGDLKMRFLNKPVLIDFWASWCLPCLQKIPEIIETKTKFPALNIVFISLDLSHGVWEKYVNENDLNKFIHYRRNYQNQDSIFIQINEIPRYGLIKKGGQIEIYKSINDSIISEYIKDNF